MSLYPSRGTRRDMKVTLRKKKLEGNKVRLYLDLYDPTNFGQKRKRESIGLFLYTNPKTPIDKNHNKETLQLAESIKAKRQLELQSSTNGFKSKELLKANFLDYFQKLTDERKESAGNYGNWDSTLKHLKEHFGDYLPFNAINEQALEDFKAYLIKKLSRNSASSYFAKVKASLNSAFDKKIIEDNPAKRVKAIRPETPKREFLTESELRSLAKEECDMPILKSAFLFSCLTGLRWSDVLNLTWRNIYGDAEAGYYILYQQDKTSKHENLPLTNNAFNLLGNRKADDDKVFEGLKYSAWHNLKLQQWVMRAGIKKTITFHCARHTYATLLLTNNVDIYTVSKLLGHSEIKTTQIYTKVIDENKKIAVNKLPEINWD